MPDSLVAFQNNRSDRSQDRGIVRCDRCRRERSLSCHARGKKALFYQGDTGGTASIPTRGDRSCGIVGRASVGGNQIRGHFGPRERRPTRRAGGDGSRCLFHRRRERLSPAVGSPRLALCGSYHGQIHDKTLRQDASDDNHRLYGHRFGTTRPGTLQRGRAHENRNSHGMVARIDGNHAHDGTERDSRGVRSIEDDDAYSTCSDIPAVQHHYGRNPIRLARLDRVQISCGL